MKIINVTPHTIDFRDAQSGKEYVVEPSGTIVSAVPVEEPVPSRISSATDVEFVRTTFRRETKTESILKELLCDNVSGVCHKCGSVTVEEGTHLIPESAWCANCKERTYVRLEEAIIVGSIIAAQSYPGLVYAMTPTPGYERVPAGQKRMNPRKFTTFA